MGELVVRQPHLGRDAIALLGRIVDSQADGVALDDMEPYLLVRLRRCGYVRATDTDAWAFVATQTGLERWRSETLAAVRRQADAERREIIRRQVQALRDRIEFDGPTRPAPVLPDFGLPAHREPRQPPDRAGALPMAPSSRTISDDGLRVIRDAQLRASHELPMMPTSSLPVVHVGRLPTKRDDEVPAEHDDDLPPFLFSDLAEDAEDLPTPHDEEQRPKDAAKCGGWGRVAVVGLGAAVVLLLAGPVAYRYLSPRVEALAEALVEQSPAQTATPALAANTATSNDVVRPSEAVADGHTGGDPLAIPSGSAIKPASATTPAPNAVAPLRETVAPARAPKPRTAPPTHQEASVVMPPLAVDASAPVNRTGVTEVATTAKVVLPPVVVPTPPVTKPPFTTAAFAKASSGGAGSPPAIAVPAAAAPNNPTSAMAAPTAAAAPAAAAAPVVASHADTPQGMTPTSVPPVVSSPSIVATSMADVVSPPVTPAPIVSSRAVATPVYEATPIAVAGSPPPAEHTVAKPAIVATPTVAAASSTPAPAPVVAERAVAIPAVVAAPPTPVAPPPAAASPAVALRADTTPTLATPVLSTAFAPAVAAPVVAKNTAGTRNVVATQVFAAANPVAAPPSDMAPSPEPARARHASEHAAVTEGTKNPHVVAAMKTSSVPPPSVNRQDAGIALPQDAATRVLDRLRAGNVSDDAMVDRLNLLSLQAAQHGRKFSPPGAMNRSFPPAL